MRLRSGEGDGSVLTSSLLSPVPLGSGNGKELFWSFFNQNLRNKYGQFFSSKFDYFHHVIHKEIVVYTIMLLTSTMAHTTTWIELRHWSCTIYMARLSQVSPFEMLVVMISN
jgi:hypothetical protein